MILQFRGVDKAFGEKQVLKGVSFEAESGKAFGLLGRNGAGKTTAIRILMNVFPADQGEVLVDGKPIDHQAIGTGYMPEERGLYPKKVIIDQLIYFAQLKGMEKKAAVQSIDYWLDRLGMREYRNKRLDTLSKGNQQKIQLITALAHNPKLIVLDEPFSGLDPVNAMLLKDVVKEQISMDKIVLFSSHQMHYIEEFCDSIAILNAGKVALHGDIREIKKSYVRDKLIVHSSQSEEILREFEGMASRISGEELLLKLPSPSEKQGVMQRLTSTYDVDEIKVFEPSLNDVFVEFAGGQV